MMKRALPLVVLFAAATALGAQDADRLAFEVASVRPNPTGEGGMSFNSPPGRFVATNTTLRWLVINAYGLARYQVEGGPAWVDDIGFDIAASAGDGPPDQQMAMLQTLLADRFGLVVHFETRDEDVFALEVDDADKARAAISPTRDDCAAIREARLTAGAEPGPASRSERPVCTQLLRGQPRPSGLTMVFSAGGITMAGLAAWVEQQAGRPVVDRTDMAGEFDLSVEFSVSQLSTSTVPVEDAPPIFVALEEQLGLRVRRTRGPVQHLVVDSAERPEPN